MESGVEHRGERILETVYRRRGNTDEPNLAGLLVELIQLEDPRRQPSWDSLTHFGVDFKVYFHAAHSSSHFLSSSAAAYLQEASGVFYPEKYDVVEHPQGTYWWVWEPTSMTELSDYSDARSELVTRAEPAQSAQLDRYSHVIEAMLEDYSHTGEASKSSETEAELVSEAEETDAELVLKALGNPKFEWRTIPGVVEETGLDPETVANVLSEFNGVVVKSSRYTTDGRALYTTRSRYEEFAPLWRKILGAVKNQID